MSLIGFKSYTGLTRICYKDNEKEVNPGRNTYYFYLLHI
ncbi:unknown [Bacteroides clarus CAG:160]|nr:unknown [Bacteroides clarus CAG:160]